MVVARGGDVELNKNTMFVMLVMRKRRILILFIDLAHKYAFVILKVIFIIHKETTIISHLVVLPQFSS